MIKQKQTRVGTGAEVLTLKKVIERLNQRNNKMKLKKKDSNKKSKIQPSYTYYIIYSIVLINNYKSYIKVRKVLKKFN